LFEELEAHSSYSWRPRATNKSTDLQIRNSGWLDNGIQKVKQRLQAPAR
jgi:hypothetical protein